MENRIFTINGFDFRTQPGFGGRPQVTGVHAHGSAARHWAQQCPDTSWEIYRAGQAVDNIYCEPPYEPEEIAAVLLEYDADTQAETIR